MEGRGLNAALALLVTVTLGFLLESTEVIEAVASSHIPQETICVAAFSNFVVIARITHPGYGARSLGTASPALFCPRSGE
jgi:hypothetical protein